MGFIDDKQEAGPIAIQGGVNVNPEEQESDTSVLGAAFRLENPIVSYVTDYRVDESVPFDPEYRPFEDIQGTEYEGYARRFSNARTRADVVGIKAQIDRETEDRRALDAAGGWGLAAQFSAALMSPTTLLPGGVVVKGAQGVRIGQTALSVSASAGIAAAMDEAVLMSSQQTRTAEDSALAIGGSIILGGILGAAAGKLTQAEFSRASRQLEQNLVVQQEFTESLRSVGAAENRQDMTLRREETLAMVRKVPYLRGLVRTSPLLRTVLSALDETRRVSAQLVESPYQYRINDEGQSVLGGEVSVETRVNDCVDVELVKSLSDLDRAYETYWADGPVGIVGRFTQPVTRQFERLTTRTEKLSKEEFMNEVGIALRSQDKHPIGEVQNAAEALRRDVFDKIKGEAEELGLWDADLQIRHGESYFTRVYDQNKIAANFENGSADDLVTVLEKEFANRRDIAQQNAAFDRTLDNLRADQMQLREKVGQLDRNLTKARKKLTEKRGRAENAIMREGAVGRASAGLRRAFEARRAGLEAATFTKDEREALGMALREARAVKRLRPRDILGAIRDFGGIKDPRTGSKPTEIELILDRTAVTVRRNDGMDIDYMREALVEAGYLPDDATVNDLLDAMDRAARGEDVFSRFEISEEVARYEAAQEFARQLEEVGIDKALPIDEIIKQLPGKARNQSAQRAKAGEAGRSGAKAGETEDAASARLTSALERLENVRKQLSDFDEVVGPKVRDEIKAARADLQKLRPEIKKAQKAKETEEFYADASDLEIKEAARDAARAIIGLKPGEPSYRAALANPTRARTLDVPDKVLEPWLVSNAQVVANSYVRSMVPDIELKRTFGDLDLTQQVEAIQQEAAAKMAAAGSASQRKAIQKEAVENVRDLMGMRDRIRGTYGQPNDPTSGWVFAGRTGRMLSYTGYLGGMAISAIPDIATVIGRSGIAGVFGASADLVMNPKRLFFGAVDMADIGSASEWFLQTRMMSMMEVFDQYGTGTRGERVLGQVGAAFSKATLMTHWNVGWKSIGGTAVASNIAKAADAMRAGTATPKQKRLLGADGIEPWMAERIAAQLDQFGDKNGHTWLPRGQNWTDQEAFMAFRRAMNREFRMMVITPGQDKPLSFSHEVGKFIFQFKSFGFSAYERILIAGLQRSDADVLLQATSAILLGGLVSNIKADMGGYDRKEGVAFWEDALDRSGLAGWLFEPYNVLAGATGGATSVSGEVVSRYQARSEFEGLFGPTVDAARQIYGAAGATLRGDANFRDARALMRPIPGNNLFYLLDISQRVEDAVGKVIGANPRPR